MKRLRFVLSLITCENDFQRLQASAAEEAARRLGVDLEIVYAENDSLTQSQQLLERIQSTVARPDAILFHPAGTALAQVAQAAASAGIGWAVLNKDAEYITDLRRKYQTPIFSVSADHLEIGRIQARQYAALLPVGGIVLYILGPAGSAAAELRLKGMNFHKPSNIEVRTIRGNWTEESAYKAMIFWLRLSTSFDLPLGLVAGQNDAMAMGARKAIHDHAIGRQRERFLRLPFTGCDGVPETGKEWIRKGLMAATVIMPPNAGTAMEMMVEALRTGLRPPAGTLVPTVGYPSIQDLNYRGATAMAQSIA